MREELIIAGLGGQGVLLMGEILARAATVEGKETVCVPAYGPEVRGGRAHSSVIISDNSIGAVLVTKADTLILMHGAAVDSIADILKPGGWLFWNSSLVKEQTMQQAVRSVKIPVNEIAEALGSSRVANTVMLGAYAGAKKVISAESCLEALKFGLRGRAVALAEVNERAFAEGFRLATEIVRKGSN